MAAPRAAPKAWVSVIVRFNVGNRSSRSMNCGLPLRSINVALAGNAIDNGAVASVRRVMGLRAWAVAASRAILSAMVAAAAAAVPGSRLQNATFLHSSSSRFAVHDAAAAALHCFAASLVPYRPLASCSAFPAGGVAPRDQRATPEGSSTGGRQFRIVIEAARRSGCLLGGFRLS